MKLITRVFLLAAVLLMPALSSAGTYVSITVAPPELPIYAQPVCPGDGYIWTPGYWAWDGDEYYWVPGTWVLAPAVDVFWTPGYWGWGGGFYLWHAGYWGPHVGFYGGVNYGYGYGGVGYQGGRWERGRFHYNRAVNNVNVVNIHNTYNTTVINNNGGSRVSFNGGDGGVRAQPNAREIAAARDHHIGFTSVQRQHEQGARSDRAMRFSENRGNPATAATQRPFNTGRAAVTHGPDAASRGSQERMPSSNFAPHANNGQGNVSRGHQINGVVNDRAEAPRGNVQSAPRTAMPSSGYAPRQQSRPQPANGNMPQPMREAGPRGPVGNQMNGQVRGPGANPMNGGQMRGPNGGEHRAGSGPGPGPGAGQRPQAEHRREER